MDAATIYVNAPLNKEEHQALKTLARENGRAKGQELRALAVSKLCALGFLKPPATGRKLKSARKP